MLFRTIVSAFFFQPASSHGDLAQLIGRLPMRDVAAFDATTRVSLGFHEPDRQILGGNWANFQETWATSDDVDDVRCLQLYSPAGRYLHAVRAAQERGYPKDSALSGYTGTFREACLALKPKAAFLDTHAHYEDEAWDNKQGSRDFVLKHAPLIASDDATALANELFSLLYLDNDMFAHWTPVPPWDDRDILELSTGRLLFASRGSPLMV
jgi:hypothetical protein